jgi:mannose-6-phosphate isomerase-like protein (cupin superfamily)
MGSVSYRSSGTDQELLAAALRELDAPLAAEQFDDPRHAYLDELIPKPWGSEFRAYADDFYDVWKLRLWSGHGTSLHCHPRKQTALLCLAGRGRLELVGAERPITAGESVVLGRGVFHRTRNTGRVDLHLVEIEVPRNKFDLVRLDDHYGRRGAAYENREVAAAVPLRPGVLTRHSKLRRGADQDGFTFDVRAGLEVVSNPEPGTDFAVSLSVADAISQRITVLDPAGMERVANHEQLYLTIARTEARTIARTEARAQEKE